MMNKLPNVNMKKTGENLRSLFKKHGYSVRDVQRYLCLGSNQAIYSWLNGRNLPTVDNFVALSCMLNTPIDNLIIRDCPK